MPDTLPAPAPALIAGAFTPSTIDTAARTVVATISAGAPVPRRDQTGAFIEVLSLDGIDPARVVGVPVLDSHRLDSVERVVGVVTEAGRDAAGLWARIKVSERAEPLWRDIVAGILRSLSVGYSVQRWEPSRGADGVPVRTATAWTVVEVSFVPVAADPGATVRAKEGVMPDDVKPEPDPAAAGSDTTADFKPCPDCPTPAGCRKAGLCVVAAEAEAAGPAAATPAAKPDEVRSLARSLGLAPMWANELIQRGATTADVRAAAFSALATATPPQVRTEQPRITVGMSHDAPATRAAMMGEALFCRINPNHQPSEPARQYAYATPADMARELLHLRGITTAGMSPAAIITRSLHTTSDFPVILGETMGRTLRQAYQAAPSGIRRAARVTSANDFRTKYSVQLSEGPILKKITESGEITAGSMAEAVETYKVETFARKLRITRQSLVNDDLGAFSDLTRRFGQAAAETEALELVLLLAKNSGGGPKLRDNKNLFHADHKNLAGSGGAISDTTLSAAREAMRTQKGLNGQTISAPPKFLVVPAALETTGEKWIATITPPDAASVNPFSGKLELVVEPRLDAVSRTRWYLAADPAVIDGLEIAYLTGSNGPLVEPVKDADTDGVTLKVIHDFGVGAVEHRSWYANPGA